MKLRIISDLHIDINKNHLEFFSWADKDILTLIAGDIAGDLKIAAPFVREHFNNAILIGGNHIVYNNERKSIQRLHMDYRAEFPLATSISYLENDYKEIGDTVFIGATLWTDYAFRGTVKENMEHATSMNDFWWGNFESSGKNIPLHPQHCFNMFNESLIFIKTTYDKFDRIGKKIVLIVHHGISPTTIVKKYKNAIMNASFISDLEDYITQNLPNVALIIHGHVHDRFQYKIGNIPVICNPCGYIERGEDKNIPAWDKDFFVEI